MLLHVVPMSECLLFVSYSYDNNRKFTYGSPNGCYAAGVLPLVVAVGAIGLMFVQVMITLQPQTMAREYFTIKEKATTRAFS